MKWKVAKNKTLVWPQLTLNWMITWSPMFLNSFFHWNVGSHTRRLSFLCESRPDFLDSLWLTLNWPCAHVSRQKVMRRSQHARKETEFLRLKRTRLGLDDFESLKVIGRGAFGEVCVSSSHAWAPHPVAILQWGMLERVVAKCVITSPG